MSNKQVCKPSCNDVLFGKGPKCQNHHGNCYFREGVLINKIQYVQATKAVEKDAIANHILHSVKRLNPPGRFLKKADDGKYYASSDKDALAKIKQALRENGKNVKDKISGATMGTKTSATTMLSKTQNASVVTKAVAVKGDMKRSATTMLSKTKKTSVVNNAVVMKKGTAKRSKTPPKATATTVSKASVVTKDDMAKLANLILDMD